MAEQKRLLLIAAVWPEPHSSGAGLRMMKLIALFQKAGFCIDIASAAGDSPYMADLLAMGLQQHHIRVNDDAFDALLLQLQPHIVLFDRFVMEEQFGWRVEKHCPQAMRLLETIDLHCLRDARHKQVKQTGKVASALPPLLQQTDVAKRELAAIYRSDLSLLISSFEVEVLQQSFGVSGHILHYAPFMFAPSDRVPEPPSFAQRQHFVSIGNFLHAPNWDAVLWLKQEIWPLIRKALPEAELHVYGAYTPEKAKALHCPQQGFLVLGRADSALQVMQKARVCLAAVRFGAGMKTKLCDALLAGTPSVTTSIGFEGMSPDDRWAGAYHDRAEDIAQAAVDLYQHQEYWQQAQYRIQEILAEHFSEAYHAQVLMHRVMAVLEHLDEHRQLNFTGSMLRFHHHRSSEYMSRWIAVKEELAAQKRLVGDAGFEPATPAV